MAFVLGLLGCVELRVDRPATSLATGHRGWNRQPGGSRPGSAARRSGSAALDRSRGSRLGTTDSSAFVYGCCGSRTTSRAGPSSTIRPRYITAIRSAKCAAVDRSCVIISTLMSPDRRSPSSSFSTPARTETSSIETGSSATRSFGIEHEARRDRDPLALPARELVREPLEEHARAASARPARARRDDLRRALRLARRRRRGSAAVPRSPAARGSRGSRDSYGSW